MNGSNLVLVVVAVAVALVAVLWRIRTSTEDAGDGAPMSRDMRRILVVYLLGLGALLIYVLIELHAIDFPDMTTSVEGSGTADIAALSKGDGPALYHVFAYFNRRSRPGEPSSYELALYGDRFQKDATVRLNDEPRAITALLDDDLITVAPQTGDLVGTGALVVEVVNPDGRRSNARSVTIARPRMPFAVFGSTWFISRELQLILMVLAAGALGSFLHGLKSLADFIGNRSAVSSWFWWYISRPFLGATMAFVFYAVLRGGFLTGTPADVRVVNPFGAIAVAALVGMFADSASQKLAEIFETLFRSVDKRGGKLAGPVIDKLVPSTVPAGTQQPIDLTIMGERLGKASAVRINGVDRAPTKSSDTQVVVPLSAPDFATAAALTISVVTPDGMSPTVTFQVTEAGLAAA